MSQKPQAFVIMPFDVEFESIYEDLIKEPLEQSGFEVARADSFLNQQNVLADIVRGIANADLVVADLTASNPNVFYELGICHGLMKPTVLLAQSVNDVPFDLRSYRLLIYETHFNKIGKLKKALREIASKSIVGSVRFSNPVSDFTDVETIDVCETASLVSQQIEPYREDDEEGLADYMKESEAAAQNLTAILNKFLKDNELVSTRIARHTASFQMLSKNPVAGSAAKYHKIALLAANDLNTFSKKVEDILPSFESTIVSLDENYSRLVNIVDPGAEQNTESLGRLRDVIQSLYQGCKPARDGLSSYRNATLDLAERKISKELNRSAKRLAEALNGILANIDRVEAFCVKILAMMDARFNFQLIERPS
jgi:hypothetical protein